MPPTVMASRGFAVTAGEEADELEAAGEGTADDLCAVRADATAVDDGADDRQGCAAQAVPVTSTAIAARMRVATRRRDLLAGTSALCVAT